MADLIASWPAQVRTQRAALARKGWPTDLELPRILAVGGMGGSAIASDLVFALAAHRLPFPAITVRDYRWPAAIGADALVLLSSYSGNTEETLSLYAEAGARGVRRLALATGGDPRSFVELLTPYQRQLETLYLGLRRAEGVETEHPLLAGEASAVVRALVRDGFAETRSGRLACTERGFLLLDGILDRLASVAPAPFDKVSSVR